MAIFQNLRVVFFSPGFVVLMLFTICSFKADGRSPIEKTQVPMAPQTSVFSQSAANFIIENQSEDYANDWYQAHNRGKVKGVALVIHGLNLRPDKMQSIISRLTESGIDVLRLSLRGHGENYAHHAGFDEAQARLAAFKAVSFPLWINEAYLAYTMVQKRALQEKVPLFLVGFSLGGLIGLDLFASQEEVQYDRMVLFAPAIKLHGIHHLSRILSPFPRLVIPSLAPDSYLSNKKGTPIAAYNALFEGLKQFEKHASPKINIPTLIFIDEEDEFIPVRAFKELIKEQNLDQWMLYIVEKEPGADQDTFHHHIIDESSTGKTVWQEMMRTTVSCLLAKKPH
jgi:alpha-beta hydrolase superfamily lysophospholipase